MAMYEDVFEEEANVSHVPELPPPNDLNHPYYASDVEPLITMNALTRFSTP
jgi:hypothetical protein